jgi:hypothetical protein
MGKDSPLGICHLGVSISQRSAQFDLAAFGYKFAGNRRGKVV